MPPIISNFISSWGHKNHLSFWNIMSDGLNSSHTRQTTCFTQISVLGASSTLNERNVYRDVRLGGSSKCKTWSLSFTVQWIHIMPINQSQSSFAAQRVAHFSSNPLRNIWGFEDGQATYPTNCRNTWRCHRNAILQTILYIMISEFGAAALPSLPLLTLSIVNYVYARSLPFGRVCKFSPGSPTSRKPAKRKKFSWHHTPCTLRKKT